MNEPFISLIVPVFNKEKYLARCIDSILHQKLDYEVVIIDDCSQDGSVKIAQQYVERHDHFHLVILPENKGVGNARNVGVEQAQGDYLLFVDSDDWCSIMSMDKIQQYAEFYGYPDCAVFAYNRYENGEFQRVVYPNQDIKGPMFHNLLDNSAVMRLYRKTNLCGSPWNKIFKREFWLTHGFSWPTVDELKDQQVEGSEDFSLIPYVIAKAKQTMIANSAYYNYDLNIDSATLSVAGDRVAASVRSAFVLRDRFLNDSSFDMQGNLGTTINAMVFAHFRHFFQQKSPSCSDDQIQQFSSIFRQYIERYKISQQDCIQIQQIQGLAADVKQEMERRSLRFNMLDMFSTQEVQDILSPSMRIKKKTLIKRIYKTLKKIFV